MNSYDAGRELEFITSLKLLILRQEPNQRKVAEEIAEVRRYRSVLGLDKYARTPTESRRVA